MIDSAVWGGSGIETGRVVGNVECCNLHLESLDGGVVSRCRWHVDCGSDYDCDCFFGPVSGFSSVYRVVEVSNLSRLVMYVSVSRVAQYPSYQLLFCNANVETVANQHQPAVQSL